MIKITEELLNKGLSDKNGFSRKQIRALGEDMSKKGWRERLLKKLVPQCDYDKFLGIKNEHLHTKRRKETENNILLGYKNFKSDQEVKKAIKEEFRYGREHNISRLLFKLIKKERYFDTMYGVKSDAEVNNLNTCEKITEDSYEMFLTKTT